MLLAQSHRILRDPTIFYAIEQNSERSIRILRDRRRRVRVRGLPTTPGTPPPSLGLTVSDGERGAGDARRPSDQISESRFRGSPFGGLVTLMMPSSWVFERSNVTERLASNSGLA